MLVDQTVARGGGEHRSIQFSVPSGIRTRVAAVKGRCPGPLDDGDGGWSSGEPGRDRMSPVGIEPTTNWLKASCSTTELRAREPTPYGAVFTLSTGVANGRGAAEIAGRSPSHVENPPRRLRHRILAETSPSWKRQP